MSLWNILRGPAKTATFASAATTLTAMACGEIENGDPFAPINAVSHITFGEEAANQNGLSWKYTGAGLMLNHSAVLSWAAFYEKFFGRAAAEGNKSMALLGGIIIAAVAYITDYYLVPKRLTPGFEKRLSGRSLFFIYAALALGLAAGGMMKREE